MKTFIKEDSKNSEALWLVIERNGNKADLKGIMGIGRDEDSAGNIAFPLLKDEIELVYNACKKYLNK